MTNLNSIKTAVFAALLSAGAMSTASTSAEAMILYNCTNTSIRVVLEGKPNGPKPSATIPANSKRAIHATKAFGPYRIVIPALGQGGWFSNRKWDGIYSLKRSGGGNIGLRNGNACPPVEVRPDPDNGNDRDRPDYGDERDHIRWCLSKYSSYNPETNQYRTYSGRYRDCISPFKG